MYRYCKAVRFLNTTPAILFVFRERDADGPERPPAVSGFRIPVPTDHHTVHTNNHNHNLITKYILDSYVRRKIYSCYTVNI